MLAAAILFLVFLLFMTFGGLYICLYILSFFLKKKEIYEDDDVNKKILIYCSVLNGEDKIVDRINNIFDSNYPLGNIAVVIVSDGSTDNTVSVVESYIENNSGLDVRLLVNDQNLGVYNAQNQVADIYTDFDVFIKTDLDTSFDKAFLGKVSAAFADERVGVVGGVLKFSSDKSSAISKIYLHYRNFEFKLRSLESSFSLGCKVDGAAVAYRPEIWKPIKPFEDADQVLPLLAKLLGFLTIQVDAAVAYEKSIDSSSKELIVRRRMTKKALLSFCNRWSIDAFIKFPFFSMIYFFHKLSRFFVPFYLLFVFELFLVYFDFSGFVFVLFNAFLLIPIVLFFCSPKFRESSLGALLSTFMAYILGVYSWVIGDSDGRYIPTDKLE